MDVVDTLATDPALLLLTLGSLTFIITFLGCFGALRDIATLLKMTVFNSMCGYKSQGMEESFIKKRIYSSGCLNKIVLWGKQNLLLVGGISIGLLCLEICMITLAAAQLSHIQKNEKKENYRPKQEVI
ncbi:tetraspanin-33-like [Clarias magur]|uniref:Tetraspanin-33-like n=1 Tax=Clarias magur TaxID=1594786 RepID=A0A8J5C9N3_CLAMG|nr:tetraspanin-33-like [Clarias magur]